MSLRLDDASEAWSHDEIPNSRLTWLDDLGHYPMIESPSRWAEAVLEFYG